MKRTLLPDKLVLLCLTAFTLTSCFHEDEMVTPLKPGDVKTVMIEMLPEYTLQTFFSLSLDSVTGTNERTQWDIALSCDPDDYTLWLNTSVMMYAARTGSTDFSAVPNPAAAEWHFDESTGDTAGNAIGRWWKQQNGVLQSKMEVFLIALGVDDEGISTGYVKIQPLIDAQTQKVSLRIAKPDGSNERTFVLPRDAGRRKVCLSFNNGYLNPQIEPETQNWDLLFSTYTTLLFTDEGEPYPYLVNGVLINDTEILAALDTQHVFEEITRQEAEDMLLSPQMDTIGYDWKKVNGDVTSGNITYTTLPKRNYIIRNRKGALYKLRFIDFYNSQGKKGYPTFEYQRL